MGQEAAAILSHGSSDEPPGAMPDLVALADAQTGADRGDPALSPEIIHASDQPRLVGRATDNCRRGQRA